MKKVFCTFVMLTAFSFCAFADGPDDTDDHYDAQFILTDCGTEHQIPANSTEEQAIEWLNRYTEEDCH